MRTASRCLSNIAFAYFLTAALTLVPRVSAGQDDPSVTKLAQDFQPKIRPLLKQYCYECHAGDRTEAEIDLGSVTSMSEVRKSPKTWQRVREMLDSSQMPPKEAKQPSDTERSELRKWVRGYLVAEAKARAGDPGPVVLRRLSNAEYTYTMRDLTGIESLDPTREFPIDGAAGEGFTNTGNALVMSPSLIRKYLDAAKEIASHAVLLPDGIRFSPHVTRRDWTDEMVARIQTFHRDFTVSRGGSAVNLQGIQFETNQGGRLPLDRYLAATLANRDAMASGKKSVKTVAREHGLNAKYLGIVWEALTADSKEDDSFLLDQVRARWRAAQPKDVPALTAEIAAWQKALWKFSSIGHIGRAGGAKAWMEPVTPIVANREFKLKLPESPKDKDVIVYLSASDAGDGNASDFVVWKNARLEGGNRPPLLLRDVAGLRERLTKLRREMLSKTAKYLAAAAEAATDPTTDPKELQAKITALAAKHHVDAALLTVWLDYLNLRVGEPVAVKGHFEKKMLNASNYEFINGWGSHDTPLILANSSDQEVRIPGISRPHSVIVHPSPTLFSAVGWSSPVSGVVRVEARIADAHPECGNGVEWFVQHRTGRKVGNLWQGDFGTRGTATMPAKTIAVREGDLVSFVVGPRGGNHGCDLTEINLVITETGGGQRTWDLAKEISANILDGNPHADRHGNKQTWHFYNGPMAGVLKKQARPVAVPPGSRLARWLAEKDAGKRSELATRVQALAMGKPPAENSSPDAVLFENLQSLALPLDSTSLLKGVKPDPRFGKHPLGHAMEMSDLVVKAHNVVEFHLPAELAAGRELVATGRLESEHGREGTVQLQISTAKPDNRGLAPGQPIVVEDGSKTRGRIDSALAGFRNLFPPAVCYDRIVPVDEAVTLTLFFREDHHLKRLMLDKAQTAELDRLWDELLYVTQEPLKYQVAFEQIREFATQDRPDLVKEWAPLVDGVNARAKAFQKRLVKTEPAHIKALLEFADQAWRRRLTVSEQQKLRNLYHKLRDNELSHHEAIRLTLARVLTSPAFLYRLEKPSSGEKAAPVSSLELANRLSYFLWSSMPDDELRRVAEGGKLTDTKTLVAQTRRMLEDARTRRLAVQFACQWLHIRDFDQNDEKNEKLYPEFAKLRGEMYEESVRFFEDMFRNDGSVLELLNANHTFLNESLAKHYGIKGVRGTSFRRVDGVRERGRGGVLGMATVLASQSGASRTSPILRGNWIFETLLGERLPRPPAKVPQLPDTVPSELTARQLIERHSSVAACAKCHAKIDPYGFALEQYDAIGRLRPKAVDTKTKLADGKTIEGIDGLRDYLMQDRRENVVQQFCRKLLGYALGREVQLSDEPLLAELHQQLEGNDYRFNAAIELIVTSRQFRDIRGKSFNFNP